MGGNRSAQGSPRWSTPEVLAAIVDGLNVDDARALIAKREPAYFRDIADFTSRLPGGAAVAIRDVSVSSAYFVATMRVTMGGAEARGTALLAREYTGWPAIVWRKLS